MANETREDRMRKLLNELEMQIDLGVGMKPFGRFVSSKELQPILDGLKKELSQMEEEKNMTAQVIKDAEKTANEH